ncbi:MAG: hypothetical protein SH856_03020 [Flavobacteriales bacterium]|nr:hypothetical protein [Flavobacteriales bacterium]
MTEPVVSKHIVVLVYNSFGDPLCSSFFMSYLKPFTTGSYSFHLITFEQKEYAFSEDERRNISNDLLAQNISWYPMKYMSGHFILIKKIFNFLSAFCIIAQLKMKWRPALMLSMSNVAGSMAYVCSRLLRIKNCILIYEPHADFMADFGYWKKSGLKYKLLHTLEQRAGRRSEFILTGTKRLRDELAPVAKGNIIRAPSAVDENVFQFSGEARTQIRTMLGLRKEQPVLIYAGKFGGLYYEKEIPEFLAKLKKEIPDMFFLIITREDHQRILNMMSNAGVNSNLYHLESAHSPKEMRAWYSAADIGLSGVPPFPSQKYRSPVKVGEYLMCGLPYITCRGISEDDKAVLEKNVGVMVESLPGGDVKVAAEEIKSLFKEDKTQLRKRCREAGIEYRSLQNVIPILKQIFESA